MAPHPVAQSALGLIKEVTRGTSPGNANVWIPVRNPQKEDPWKALEDNGSRGWMSADPSAIVQGPGNGDLGWAGDFFVDSTPNMLMGLLGSDTVTAGAVFYDVSTTNTTTTITSPTANFSTALDAGKTITGTGIPGGATIASVTNATTAVLSAAATATGTVTATIARTSAQSHAMGLLNNSASTGNQPPSYTMVDYNGVNTRQFTGMQMAELAMKFGAETLFEYQAKSIGNQSTVVTDQTPAASALVPEAGWMAQMVIAGAADPRLEALDLTVKRAVKPIWTARGSRDPYLVFAPGLSVSGKATFLYEADANELTQFLNNTQPAVYIRISQPVTGSSFFVQMSVCAFTGAKELRSKDHVQIETALSPINNATDAVAGGQAQAKFQVINTQSAAY